MTRINLRTSRFALILGAGLACASSIALAQTADEIVAANIAATGGAEAIARIENFTSTGQVHIDSPLFGQLDGTFKAVRVPGKGYYEAIDLTVAQVNKGWDGTNAWEQGPNGLRMLEAQDAASLQIQSFVAPFVALREAAAADLRIERLDDVDLNGRPHYALLVSSGSSSPSTQLVDRETGLVSQSIGVAMVQGLGEQKSVTSFSDYESVGGVMLATVVTVAMEGISTTRVTLENTVVNTDVDESVFGLPDASGSDAQAAAPAPAPADPYGGPYQEHCSVCHGSALEGAYQGVPLAGVTLKHGDSTDAISNSIASGIAGTAMPAWSETLDADTIRRLAIFIGEQRAALSYADFKVATPPAIPTGPVASEEHDFLVEIVAEGIDPLPYSIALLPDGRMLVTEKTRGLRIVSQDGALSELIRGTPQAFDDGFQVPGILLVYGQGYLLDVALHPDYARNGWIYLSYTERCSNCNTASAGGQSVSMVALARGRIEDGAWVDAETIWKADMERYTAMPDMAAGGRIAFDDDGHVFLTIGIKGGSETAGIQDLSMPYGKILRLDDDGSVPDDNPFVGRADALASIWSYGHRSPQGLEFDPRTDRLWGTEMGQRGGDEVNLIERGGNYGWPLVSKGMQYTGQPVAFAAELGITFNLADIEQPVVDLTPAVAVSSFVVYDGAAFPEWRGNLLVGSLKATNLYRMVVDGASVENREMLLEGIGRIRDVETDADGLVYLLLEHDSGGRIVRLVPRD